MDKDSIIILHKVMWGLYIKALQTGKLLPNCIEIDINNLRDDYHSFKTTL